VLLLKLVVMVVMLTGLFFTVVPRVPGTLVIVAGAAMYGAFTEFAGFTPPLMLTLGILVVIAELGGRWLRVHLTRYAALSRSFCASSTIGNIGGILAADALFGPVIGFLIWELVVGKTLTPRWDSIRRVLVRLAAVAALRFACGLVMIILVLLYIF
jgi:uncharacterized protein YqgC (DUF456 family)